MGRNIAVLVLHGQASVADDHSKCHGGTLQIPL